MERIPSEQEKARQHIGSVRTLAFLLDEAGSVLASGGDDKTAKLWRIDDSGGELLTTLEVNDGSVTNVVFSPSGLLLAVATSDGTVSLWGIKK